jgi:tRNA(Ile)-lysidine synthase
LLEGYGFSYDHCDAIAKSDLSRVGNQFENEYARLVVDRQFLIINFKVAEPQKFPLIQQASGVHAVSNQLLALKLVRKEEVVFSPNRAYFDADLLPFPLIWRNWQAGDKFQPFGLEGTKNVSDYLIDLKIPQVEKDKQTVLLTEDKIIWLVGKRQSEHFRLSEQTKMAVEINFTLIND